MNSPIAIIFLCLTLIAGMLPAQTGKRATETPLLEVEGPILKTTLPISSTPIICVDNLSAAELKRRGELSLRLKRLVGKAEPIPQGFRLRLPAELKLAELIEWIGVERRCCPFLTFDLIFPPDGGPTTLRIVGGKGVQDFLANVFFK